VNRVYPLTEGLHVCEVRNVASESLVGSPVVWVWLCNGTVDYVCSHVDRQEQEELVPNTNVRQEQEEQPAIVRVVIPDENVVEEDEDEKHEEEEEEEKNEEEDADDHHEPNTSLRRSTRNSQPPLRLIEENAYEVAQLTYEEAMSHPKWTEATKKEILNMKREKVFIPVKRTPDMNVIDSTWTYKLKTDGTHKARLCARGFKQKVGIDYLDYLLI